MKVGDIVRWQRKWDLNDKDCFALAIIIKFGHYNDLVTIQEVATGIKTTVKPTFLSEIQ